MIMIDYIVIGILVIITFAAAGYIYRAKKSGKKCIGCPDGGSCSSGCGGCGGSCSHCVGQESPRR